MQNCGNLKYCPSSMYRPKYRNANLTMMECLHRPGHFTRQQRQESCYFTLKWWISTAKLSIRSWFFGTLAGKTYPAIFESQDSCGFIAIFTSVKERLVSVPPPNWSTIHWWKCGVLYGGWGNSSAWKEWIAIGKSRTHQSWSLRNLTSISLWDLLVPS